MHSTMHSTTQPLQKRYTELPHCDVELVGLQEPIGENDRNSQLCRATSIVSQLGAQPTKICHVLPPSDEGSEGFQSIAIPNFNRTVKAEGVVLTDIASGAFLQTRDCPTVVLSSEESRTVVMFHAGKWALMPSRTCGACSYNVIRPAVRKFKSEELPYVHAYITGGISPTRFPHETQKSREAIAPIINKYGEAVFVEDFAKGFLDLKKLIRFDLVALGLRSEHIYDDGLCTYEEGGLSSLRWVNDQLYPDAHRKTLNTVAVVVK